MRFLRVVLSTAAVVVVVIVVAVVSLDYELDNAIKAHQRGDAACPHDKELRTYQQWLQTTRFPYNAPRERVRQVVDNYGQVKVGSSKKEVIEALGQPDFEQEMIPKEPWRPRVGYEFLYYLEKSDGENGKEFEDSRIEIFFTADGRADWIVPSVAGLPPKGSCCSSK